MKPNSKMHAIVDYHLGLIPDGNRRWAEVNHVHPSEGHKQGKLKMDLFLKWVLNKPEIKEITIFGLSEENYRRNPEELKWLYDIYYKGLDELRKGNTIHDQQMQMNFITTRDTPLPGNLKEMFSELKRETKSYGNKVFNLLIGYSGQNEILRATSQPLNRIKNLFFGLTEEDLVKGLGVKRECDLIIRTAHEEAPREAKSGFLLWQSAYAEYCHINKYFPDIEARDLNKAWANFMEMRRRKGK